jgi:23S rRNA-/tRNA-specific pseudouridylate synthase
VGLPDIIFEDETMVAFDKPCGLRVAPDRLDQTRENLMALVHAKLGQHVASVHRLDTDTSGVFLCAKSKPALDFLSGQFQSKTVEKVYLALVVPLPSERAMKLSVAGVVREPGGGLPENFTVDHALDEDQHQQGRMRVSRKPGAKPSVTGFRVLERFGAFALLECQPFTSTLHQIRVHLAAVGAPVLNDSFYGDSEVKLLLSDLKRRYKGRDDERPLIDRLALHASELTVKHPVTREPVTMRAALPKEFEVALKYLRKFSLRPGVRVSR